MSLERWQQLPSGQFLALPEATGYVLPVEGRAYWWLVRRGKTIVEGPAASVEEGRQEVKLAAQEFLRG